MTGQPMEGPAGHAGLAEAAQLEALPYPAAAAEEGEQALPDPAAAAEEGVRTPPNPTSALEEGEQPLPDALAPLVAGVQTLSNPAAALEEGEQPLPDALAPLVAGLRRTGKLPAALAALRDCSVAEVKQARPGSMCPGLGLSATRMAPTLRLRILMLSSMPDAAWQAWTLRCIVDK